MKDYPSKSAKLLFVERFASELYTQRFQLNLSKRFRRAGSSLVEYIKPSAKYRLFSERSASSSYYFLCYKLQDTMSGPVIELPPGEYTIERLISIPWVSIVEHVVHSTFDSPITLTSAPTNRVIVSKNL